LPLKTTEQETAAQCQQKNHSYWSPHTLALKFSQLINVYRS